MTHRDRSLPPTSEEIAQLVAGYVLNTLDEPEAEQLAQALADNPALQQEIEKLEGTLEQAYEVTEAPPPPALRARIMDAVPRSSFSPASPSPASPSLASPSPAESVAELTETNEPVAGRPHKWGRWLAAGAIVTLTISNLVLWQTTRRLATAVRDQPSNDRPISDASTPNPTTAETYPLVSTAQETANTTATVTIDPATLDATLEAQQLPPLPPNQVYVLWTVVKPDAPYTTDEQGAILTATFQPGDDGAVMERVRVPAVFQSDWVAGLGVTVESATAPQGHAATPILATESLL
ncbi:MAG: anti-sigma factor [Cyanobacteria bacterium P01_A01_bin.105]